MKSPLNSLIMSAMILMTACGPSHDRAVRTIRSMEKRLFSARSVEFSKDKADSLRNLYEDFVKNFPKDSLVPSFLYRAGNVAMNIGEGPHAMELFDRLLKSYPAYPRAPLCLFFKAYIEENDLHNLEKAKEIYMQFIEKYPAHEFVPSARAAISNLGKTPDQMVKEFEAKKKADSARVADSMAVAGKHKKKK